MQYARRNPCDRTFALFSPRHRHFIATSFCPHMTAVSRAQPRTARAPEAASTTRLRRSCSRSRLRGLTPSRCAAGLLGTWMEDTGGKSGRRPARHLQVEASGPGNAAGVQQRLAGRFGGGEIAQGRACAVWLKVDAPELSSGPGWMIQEVSRVGAQGATSKSKLLAREMSRMQQRLVGPRSGENWSLQVRAWLSRQSTPGVDIFSHGGGRRPRGAAGLRPRASRCGRRADPAPLPRCLGRPSQDWCAPFRHPTQAGRAPPL